MKKSIFQDITILLLVSCSSTTTATPQGYAPIVIEESQVPSSIPPPTSTPMPAPTQTLAPIIQTRIEASPLALNEFNAGTELKLLNIFGTGNPNDIQFSPDGNFLAIATGRGVYLYNGNSFEQTGFINVNDNVTAIAFNPNGDTIALAVEGKTSIWNLASGKRLVELDDQMIYVSRIAFGTGGYIAAIGGDCRGCGTPIEAMILWDGKTGKKIFEEREIWYLTNALDFTSDGKILFFGGKDGLTSLDIENGIKTPLSKSTSSRNSAADSPIGVILDDNLGKLFVISPEAKSNEVIDVKAGTVEIFNLCQADYSNRSQIAHSKDVGICADKDELILFNLSSLKEIGRIKIDSRNRLMFAVNSEGDKIVHSSDNGFNVIEISTNETINFIRFNRFERIQAGIIELNNETIYAIAALSQPGKILIFNAESGEVIRTLHFECCEIEDFAFSPDLRSAATIHDSTISIWNIEANEITYEFSTDSYHFLSLTFSPDRTKILLTDQDYHIWEFNLQSGELAKTQAVTFLLNFDKLMSA